MYSTLTKIQVYADDCNELYEMFTNDFEKNVEILQEHKELFRCSICTMYELDCEFDDVTTPSEAAYSLLGEDINYFNHLKILKQEVIRGERNKIVQNL